MSKRILSVVLALVMCLGTVAVFSACKKDEGTKKDALVIMSDELDGLFNPFYSTTAPDGTIVSATQIGMLGSDYVDGKIAVAYGDNHAVVVKDYSTSSDPQKKTTTYTFVIKNGIKFSDGKPLTINDVMFNLYVYLDPVYTGSSTMYSTDIVGLQNYRTQTISSGNDNTDDLIAQQAASRAADRINELINLYMATGKTSTDGSYSAGYEKMKAAILAHSLSSGYKAAISADPAKVTNANLLADYDLALQYFKEELNTDYASSKDAYTEEPYKSTGEFDEVTSFMYTEGYVTIEYEKDPVTNKDLKDKIKKITRNYSTDVVKDKDSAINYVYQSKIESELHLILQYWATAQKLSTDFAAAAKEVILHTGTPDGGLKIPNISGIVSLGHTGSATEVTCKDGTYKVAKTHKADGTPAVEGEYDVLQITINGVDPKAIWNFSFAVAPHHYYSDPAKYPVDIANNKFGVEFGSFTFMTEVIKSTRNVQVPMGAGAYMATDANNSDTPSGAGFYSNNMVYFKANKNFLMGAPKIDKIRYQVVSSSNALMMLDSGKVDFITPQYTKSNIEQLEGMKDKGIVTQSTDQLGYGYIGINAGKVQDINLRKAIMAAMDTKLALSYYQVGTAETIYWPMSVVSWAYPKDGNTPNKDNMHGEYIAVNWNRETAKQKVKEYMARAGVTEGDSKLSMKFTIAGANLTDHPTYATFRQAADLLNECGWDVEVVPDIQALTKLSTGSLTVWAAAWGSALDPDMYQVYHKNSTATSTLAWGYREILGQPAKYPEENAILNDLSDLIDQARETEDQAIRAGLYKQAMGKVLDLAVEMPVYQRDVLYAYNANVIKTESLPENINPYTSPLDRIWEIEFAD